MKVAFRRTDKKTNINYMNNKKLSLW